MINFRGLKGLGIPSSLHERADSYASEVCIRLRIHPRPNIQFMAGSSASKYKMREVLRKKEVLS